MILTSFSCLHTIPRSSTAYQSHLLSLRDSPRCWGKEGTGVPTTKGGGEREKSQTWEGGAGNVPLERKVLKIHAHLESTCPFPLSFFFSPTRRMILEFLSSAPTVLYLLPPLPQASTGPVYSPLELRLLDTALQTPLHLPPGTSIPLHRRPSLSPAPPDYPSLLLWEAPTPMSRSLSPSILPKAPSRQKL